MPTNPNLDHSTNQFSDIVNEIEGGARESLHKLNDWADQARTVLDEKPGSIVSSLAIAGFMAGALLRRGNYGLSSIRNQGRGQSVDPLLVLGAGALIGWAFGPRLMSESSNATSASSSNAAGTSTTARPQSSINKVSESRH